MKLYVKCNYEELGIIDADTVLKLGAQTSAQSAGKELLAPMLGIFFKRKLRSKE